MRSILLFGGGVTTSRRSGTSRRSRACTVSCGNTASLDQVSPSAEVVEGGVQQVLSPRGRALAFRTTQGRTRRDHAETPIKRHVKVQGKRSPFDGDEVYWSSRRGIIPESRRAARLLKQQQGNGQVWPATSKLVLVMEIDHLVARREDGGDKKVELPIVTLLWPHSECCRSAVGMRVRYCTIEEPCVMKVACTVLQQGRGKRSPT